MKAPEEESWGLSIISDESKPCVRLQRPVRGLGIVLPMASEILQQVDLGKR